MPYEMVNISGEDLLVPDRQLMYNFSTYYANLAEELMVGRPPKNTRERRLLDSSKRDGGAKCYVCRTSVHGVLYYHEYVQLEHPIPHTLPFALAEIGLTHAEHRAFCHSITDNAVICSDCHRDKSNGIYHYAVDKVQGHIMEAIDKGELNKAHAESFPREVDEIARFWNKHYRTPSEMRAGIVLGTIGSLEQSSEYLVKYLICQPINSSGIQCSGQTDMLTQELYFSKKLSVWQKLPRNLLNCWVPRLVLFAVGV